METHRLPLSCWDSRLIFFILSLQWDHQSARRCNRSCLRPHIPSGIILNFSEFVLYFFLYHSVYAISAITEREAEREQGSMIQQSWPASKSKADVWPPPLCCYLNWGGCPHYFCLTGNGKAVHSAIPHPFSLIKLPTIMSVPDSLTVQIAWLTHIDSVISGGWNYVKWCVPILFSSHVCLPPSSSFRISFKLTCSSTGIRQVSSWKVILYSR